MDSRKPPIKAGEAFWNSLTESQRELMQAHLNHASLESSGRIQTAKAGFDSLLSSHQLPGVGAAEELEILARMVEISRYESDHLSAGEIAIEAAAWSEREKYRATLLARLSYAAAERNPERRIPNDSEDSTGPQLKRPKQASKLDLDRWEFSKPLREKDDPPKWSAVAILYKEKTGEPVTGNAMKMSYFRVKKWKGKDIA